MERKCIHLLNGKIDLIVIRNKNVSEKRMVEMAIDLLEKKENEWRS